MIPTVRLSWILALLLGALPVTGIARAAPVVFAPTGLASGVQQVTARFDAPMAAIGAPRDAGPPFDIDCVDGTARWIDSRTWAFDFPGTLPAGIECSFTLREGLQTLAGKPLAGGATFSFSTGGPRVLSSNPDPSATVAEDAAFVLRLDAETSITSIEENAYFRIAGVGERVGVDLLDGEEREQILATLAPRSRSGPLAIVRARQTFPPAAKVELVWAKGIETTTGIARDRDQVLAFTVRKAFHATFTCTRPKARGPCNPLGRTRLDFSAPVPWERARGAVLVDSGSDFHRAPRPPDRDDATVRALHFGGDLPPGATLELRLPGELRDEAGRELENAAAFPLAVETGPYPPLARFTAGFGILEANADPALPLTVRALGDELRGRIAAPVETLPGVVTRADAGEILPWLRRVRDARRDRSVFADLPTSDDPATLRPLAVPLPAAPGETEVIGIPLETPGLYVVEVESLPLGKALLGKAKPMYVSAAALVTNLAVHLKYGREGSIAWVTRLDDGEPAAGAEVRAYDCTGALLAAATTDPDGIARLDGLPAKQETPSCSHRGEEPPDPWRGWRGSKRSLFGIDHGVLVTATLEDDMSFVFSSWDGGLEPYRFGIATGWGQARGLHTIFGRTLLRAGDTVHMKHVLRLQTGDGFALAPPGTAPTIASIRHVGSADQVELPITWAPDGTALTTWAIPKSAKLGEYEVYLEHAPREPREDAAATNDDEKGDLRVWRPEPIGLSGRSGSFRVEAFRVPLMDAIVKLPSQALVAPNGIPVDIALRYLAGGGAGDTTVLLRSQITPQEVEPPRALAHLTFGNGVVRTGTRRDGGQSAPSRPPIHTREPVRLDAEGTARATIANLPPIERPSVLTAEIEYRDPNGESQTSSATVSLWPAEHAVGLSIEDWTGSTGRIVVETAVIDPRGDPVAGAEVEVRVFSRQHYTNRKRIVGGFYAYDSVEQTEFVHTLCHGRTDEAGRFRCRRRPPATGQLVLQAKTSDDAGRTSAAHQSVWIYGAEDAWFRPSDTDRMELVPERRRYEAGETARLQVRMPFPRARALVTVEREGVLEARVERLDGSAPVIEVPVEPQFAPNAYVSVLAVRGRTGRPQPTARVDLGKPAFRLGLTEIRVGWRAHELDVTVTPDSEVYRVRDTARVDIEVRDATGAPPPAGSEIALAAVDEGLLALVPNRSWTLLRAMMQERPDWVSTATGQMQVIGKRHFGRKALPEGGGGGLKPTRELFDTLLAWQGRIALDDSGKARVEVPLNDSLTSFRIIAVATGGVGRFGTGKASIRTTQELMVFSGLPPIVRTGDEVWSEFTVRNTTDQPVDVQLTASVDGLREDRSPLDVRLNAGEARALGWSTTIPEGTARLEWEVQARDTRGEASDRIHATQIVKPAVPVRTLQATFTQWEPPGPIDEAIARPAAARPGEGGIDVTLASSISDGLAGVRAWMQDYPYTCLEQKVSRAIALDDDAAWAAILQNLPTYFDRADLLKFFPGMDRGSPLLTAYVLEMAIAADRPLPEELRDRMIAALTRFVQGRTPTYGADPGAGGFELRKLAVLGALANAGRLEPDLLGSITIEPELWPTASVLDWWTVLLGLPDLPDRKRQLARTEKIVRTRLFEQGTTLVLSDENRTTGWWRMSNEDVDALRLVLILLTAETWQEDLPKLVRGAIARQTRGAWSTTVANAVGTLAVQRFAAVFEPEPVDGSTVVALAGHAQQGDWVRHPTGQTLQFPWPEETATLRVQHRGSGRPWVLTRARAAIALEEPLSSGFSIRRTVTPLEPREDGIARVGDVFDVRLEVQSATGHGWVVVEDPVPAGASFLGRGFANETSVTPTPGTPSGVRPDYEERSFESYRAYYERIPQGTFRVEYRIRLNQAGLFHPPPTRVEALYAPEAFAESPHETLRVVQ